MSILTKPNEQGMYDFDDAAIGVETSLVEMSPKTASVRMSLLAPEGRQMRTDYFHGAQHSLEAEKIFAPNVIMIPPSGVRLTFFIPMVGVNIHVGSDVVDNDRSCSMRVYAANGDYLGGDWSYNPFGPMPDFPTVPDGMDPKTTDWQYMVWSMPPPMPPPYSNPLHGRPCAYADFFPDGEGVYIGRVVATTSD